MEDVKHIAVVGAGHAAGQLVASLRLGGYTGNIDVFGDEPHRPYQRPPLSKAVLKGDLEPARTLLKPETWYVDQRISLHAQTRVTAIDRGERTLELAGGSTHRFDRLVIATGAAPIELPVPGAELAGVFTLRTIDDAMALQEAALPDARAVIVGGGYIGLEAAASLRALGLEVCVVERASRVLERVTSPFISNFFAALHAEHAVDVHTGAEVVAINGAEQVQSVTLGDGRVLDCDIVLVGIGITPNIALASAAQLDCDNGIVVDRDARTSDPDIYAIGDCAQRELVHYDRRGRLESVHNALEQAKLAAAHILGADRPTEDCPWFWSEQFDVKLQIAGLSQGYDELVIRGVPDERRFAAFYLRDGVLLAVDAVNSPRDFMPAKALIAARTRCDAAALGDPDVPLKSLGNGAV